MSYGAVSDMLVKPLEHHPPLTAFQTLKDVKWIVVLGGGSEVDQALPLSTYLTEASLKRLSEAVYLSQQASWQQTDCDRRKWL